MRWDGSGEFRPYGTDDDSSTVPSSGRCSRGWNWCAGLAAVRGWLALYRNFLSPSLTLRPVYSSYDINTSATILTASFHSCLHSKSLLCHLSHYRPFRGQSSQRSWLLIVVFTSIRPNQQCHNTEGHRCMSRSGFNPTRTTPPCHNNATYKTQLLSKKRLHAITSNHSWMVSVRLNPILDRL